VLFLAGPNWWPAGPSSLKYSSTSRNMSWILSTGKKNRNKMKLRNVLQLFFSLARPYAGWACFLRPCSPWSHSSSFFSCFSFAFSTSTTAVCRPTLFTRYTTISSMYWGVGVEVGCAVFATFFYSLRSDSKRIWILWFGIFAKHHSLYFRFKISHRFAYK